MTSSNKHLTRSLPNSVILMSRNQILLTHWHQYYGESKWNFAKKKIRRNSGTIVLLSENVTALKLSERLKIDEMYSRIGLSFGQPDNTYYCFKCTYNGEICHSQSKNVSAPYKAVRNSTDKNTLLMQSNFPKVRTKISRPEKRGQILWSISICNIPYVDGASHVKIVKKIILVH